MLDPQSPNAPRQHLMAILAKADRSALEAALAHFDNPPPYQLMRAPETGLVMLRGAVCTNKQGFNIGEASVTRASVRLESGEIGTSYALGRDHKKALIAAYLDALWQRPDWRAKVDAVVTKPLQESQAKKAQEFQAKVLATKVDFFTMVRGED